MESESFALAPAIALACQPTSMPEIIRGRDAVLAMDREWVLGAIEKTARETLDLDDYWEYRRLLELCLLLDSGLTRRVASWGACHVDPDVREAAEDYSQ